MKCNVMCSLYPHSGGTRKTRAVVFPLKAPLVISKRIKNKQKTNRVLVYVMFRGASDTRFQCSNSARALQTKLQPLDRSINWAFTSTKLALAPLLLTNLKKKIIINNEIKPETSYTHEKSAIKSKATTDAASSIIQQLKGRKKKRKCSLL